MNLSSIPKIVSNYNNSITNTLTETKELITQYACKDPEYLRNTYETNIQVIENKINDINKMKNYIDKCINDLENSKNILSELEKVVKEVGKISNKARVGTLFGLCRQKIQEYDIPVDEIGEAVLELPYDEKKEIENFYKLIENIEVNEDVNVGGKNNTKRRKKYIAKNVNNKKSKKRRFK